MLLLTLYREVVVSDMYSVVGWIKFLRSKESSSLSDYFVRRRFQTLLSEVIGYMVLKSVI